MKNIIFDYGGVIFDIEHGFMAQAFEDLGIPGLNDQFNHAGQAELFDVFETGSIEPAEFREGIRRLGQEFAASQQIAAGQSLSDRQIDDAWNAMLIGIPMGNLELVSQMKQKYRTFLLSNTNILHIDWISGYLRENLGIDSIASYFEKVYYSYELGMRKPNADIFEHVLKVNGLEPSETLFIDDSPQNLATAGKLGIHTRLVAKGEPLAEVLKPYL